MDKTNRLISLHTIGCRLNQYETEKMAARLYPFGFQRAVRGEPADLYLINTCTVTHKADSDCRKMIRRASRENPAGRIVVAGCYVDNDPANVDGMNGVDVIIRNAEKDSIADILPRKLPELFDREPEKNCSTLISDFGNHNRAWLKVSDGCNQWCSFCIIPTVRGRLRNRSPLEIIEEINSLVSAGYKEVVLTGVNLGHYKNRKVEPQIKNLAGLCSMILRETDLYRLRLSSIEPQTIRDELLDVYANSNGRICRHFHMPLQSGSSRILRLMQRPYDQQTYLGRLDAVRRALPETVIGADVIVGFPGESEEDFNRTRRVVETGLIDYLHVFSYSDRPGTPASSMSEKVPFDVIKERNAILTKISNCSRRKAHQRQVGKTLEVIAEHHNRTTGKLFGVADNYIRVRLPSYFPGDREIIPVRIDSAADDCVHGEPISLAVANQT